MLNQNGKLLSSTNQKQNISIQFLYIFYFLFLISPVAIFVTQKIYFAYVMVTLFILFYLYSLRINLVTRTFLYSKYLFMLFFVVNISSLWATNLNDTLLYVAIFDHVLIIYCFLSATILFSNIAQRSSIFIYIAILCFIINIFLLIKFGTVRAYHHDVREVVKSYSNFMAALMVVCLPMLFYRLKCKYTPLITILAIMFSVFNIMISESRGGLVTLLLFIMLLPFLYFRSKSNRKLTLLFTIILIIMSVLGVMHLGMYDKIEVFNRFSELENVSGVVSPNNVSDLSARLLMYHHGISVIFSHPVLGIGWGSFISSMDNTYGIGVIPHNLFIEIWTSCGILGVILLIIVFYQAFKRLYLCYIFYLHRNKNVSYWCMANIICLLLLCFHGMFRPFLSNIFLYFPLSEAFIFSRLRDEIS